MDIITRYLWVTAFKPEEVVPLIDYDEYGNITHFQNQDEFTDIGFADGLYDNHTGLVRFSARDYDLKSGRWTSKDPILFNGRQTNLYVYVNNYPIDSTDPSGKFPWVAVGAVIGAAVNVGVTYVASGGDASWRQLGGAAGSICSQCD